jgi:hypothetical protein
MKFSRNPILAFVAAGILFGFLAISAAEAAERPVNDELSRALENLRNSNAEWRREDAAYRRERAANSLSADDAAEYAEFVASLQRQKLENCEVVRDIGGDEALTGYDCVKTNKSRGALSALPPRPSKAKTDSEKLEGLEAELKRLEAELDEELRQKQQALRERQQNQSAGGGSGAKGWGPLPGQGRASGTGNNGKKGSSQEASVPGQGKSSKPATGNQSGGPKSIGKSGRQGKLPPGAANSGPRGRAGPGAGPGRKEGANPAEAAKDGRGDGNDDDIVMRQIREAAERETDPVMKEKLWNEYRKLKAAKR